MRRKKISYGSNLTCCHRKSENVTYSIYVCDDYNDKRLLVVRDKVEVYSLHENADQSLQHQTL